MLTFTQADLDNLKAALVTGAMEVQIGDRRVKYNSPKEISDLIRMIQASLDEAAEIETVNPNIIKATFSKGGS